MNEEEEWPETWDRNKVYMYTDPDGNKVPVPHGFTVSGAESEKYVNHNVEMRGTLEELTFTPGEKTWEHDESDTDKAWKLNEDGIWVSQNTNIRSSTAILSSNEFTVGENGGYLNIEWSVSSYKNPYIGTDFLSINIVDTVTGKSKDFFRCGGTDFGNSYNSLIYSKYNLELEAGKYIIRIEFIKNTRYSSNLNSGFIKGGKFLNYNENGADELEVHKSSGFVIYKGDNPVTDSNAYEESKIRDQFVWIPVHDIDTVYENNKNIPKDCAKYYTHSIRNFSVHDLSGYTKDIFYKELQNDFIQTIESIKKYGGFYIGRYETGNINQATYVVRRMNIDIASATWYNLYARIKNMYYNENIQSGMLWYFLYQELLKYIMEVENISTIELGVFSRIFGNFRDTEFSYTNTNGIISQKSSKATIMVPTGSAEKNKVINIYDLYGNMFEFSIRENSSYYSSNYGNLSESAWASISNEFTHVANCRVCIFIK